MNTEQLVSTITLEAYERLLYAVETGKWPDGTVLTKEQRDNCMQAVMLYQSKHNTEAEHMTVAAGGELSLKSKSELKKVFSNNEQDIIRTKLDKE